MQAQAFLFTHLYYLKSEYWRVSISCEVELDDVSKLCLD